jgi:hypothetical protein
MRVLVFVCAPCCKAKGFAKTETPLDVGKRMKGRLRRKTFFSYLSYLSLCLM